RGYPLAASRTPSVAWALVGRQVAGAREGAVLTETLGRADAKPGPSAPTRPLRGLKQGPTRATRVRSSLRSRASPYTRPCGLPTDERFDAALRAADTSAPANSSQTGIPLRRAPPFAGRAATPDRRKPLTRGSRCAGPPHGASRSGANRWSWRSRAAPPAK